MERDYGDHVTLKEIKAIFQRRQDHIVIKNEIVA